MKPISLLLTLVLLAGFACAPFGGEPALGNMTVRRESGEVKVLRGDETISVEDDLALEPDDVVITGARARARFNLEADRELEMLGNSRAEIRDTTSVASIKGVLRGQAAGESLRVFIDGVTASAVASNFRVDRGFGSSRVGAYSGSVSLEAPGEDRLKIEAFKEATVAAGDIPSFARPYRLDLKDTWDAVYLEDWLALQQQLDSLSAGFENVAGADRPDLPYFAELAGTNKVGFIKPYLSRKPTELLIAFTLAENSDGSLEDRFEDAFGYRDQGAEWAIAAALLSVKPPRLVASLSDIILGTGVVAASGQTDQAQFTVAAAEAATGGGQGGDTPIGSGGNDDNTGTSPPGGGGSGGGGGGGGGKTGGGGGDNEPQDCSDTVDCAGQEITDRLPPEPSPTPTEGPFNVLDGGLNPRESLAKLGELSAVLVGGMGH